MCEATACPPVQAVHSKDTREHLNRRSHRLWHGTTDSTAWERGLGHAEWHPFSRRYAVKMPGDPPLATQPIREPSPRQRSGSTASGQQAQHTQRAQHSVTPSLPALQPVPYMVPVAIPTKPTAVSVPAAPVAPRSIYVGNLVGTYRNESPPIGKHGMKPCVSCSGT